FLFALVARRFDTFLVNCYALTDVNRLVATFSVQMFHYMTSQMGALPPYPRTIRPPRPSCKKSAGTLRWNRRAVTNRDGHTRLMGREIPRGFLAPAIFQNIRS